MTGAAAQWRPLPSHPPTHTRTIGSTVDFRDMPSESIFAQGNYLMRGGRSFRFVCTTGLFLAGLFLESFRGLAILAYPTHLCLPLTKCPIMRLHLLLPVWFW